MLDYFKPGPGGSGRGPLHRGFALRPRGLAPDFFERQALDKPNATLRLLHYPPALGAARRWATRRRACILTMAMSRCCLANRRRLAGPDGAGSLGALGSTHPSCPMPSSATSAIALMRWSERCLCLRRRTRWSARRIRTVYSVAFLPSIPIRTAVVACLPTCTKRPTASENMRQSPVQSFLRSAGWSRPMRPKGVKRDYGLVPRDRSAISAF